MSNINEEKLYKKRRRREKTFEIIGKSAIFLSLAFLGILLITIVIGSLEILYPGNILDFVFFNGFSTAPTPVKDGSLGIFTPLIGSILIMLVVLVLAVPVGIIAGLYIEEYMDKKSRLYDIISVLTINLAGVPAVIYGILGATIFMFLDLRGSFVAAGVTLSLLSLPVIIISTQEALKTVPKSLKEAAYGLGMTKWQVIRGVTLPYAMSTILTGVILALSRAIGEAAPLIMVGVVVDTNTLPTGLSDKVSALPLVIDYFYAMPGKGFPLAAATSVVLLTLLILMNSIAIIIREKANKNK